MENINLYNYFQYGDLFFSRSFIIGLSEKFNITYYHNKPDLVFTDLKHIKEVRGIPSHFNVGYSNTSSGNINTWMGLDSRKYISSPRDFCSYRKYMTYAKDVFSYFGIKMKNYEHYLPEVHFRCLDNYEYLVSTTELLIQKYKKTILFCTGPTTSGQSVNFDFTPILQTLCESYKDVLFLTTANHNLQRSNVVCINETFPSLLDISYISTKVNLIVGRSSGPYVYCLTKQNLQSPDKNFVCFCTDEEHAMFFEKYNCKSVWSKNYTQESIINILSSQIKNLL